MPSIALAAPQWWHTATVYQIYPASFKDTDGDGIGDLPGVLSEVDHIAELGVDAVWLSPCYKSPLVDMGYDISDYREIDPRYGTVADVKKLIDALNRRGIRLLMDLVVNHTSSEHAWFQELRSSATNSKRDWYIWRKGRTMRNADGTTTQIPPNNWESLFKGSAWTYDQATDEWFLHIFAPEQPDLNWDNPEVRHAVHDDMRFWLDMGVSGFRMDVINMISKPPGLPDAPVIRKDRPFQPAQVHYCNGPRVHEYVREIREQVLDHYHDIMTVGEVPFTNDAGIIREYVSPNNKGLDMLFQFDIFDLDFGPGGKFTPSSWSYQDLKSAIAKWQKALSYSSGAWQTVFLESHDAARSVTRFGDGTEENRVKVAKMLAMLETTLSGTLFMHQGQEIGMANLSSDIPIDEYVDIETRGFWNDLRSARESQLREDNPGSSSHAPPAIDMSDVAEQVRLKARDHGRIPIPWDAKLPNSGFSSAPSRNTIWTPMNTDAAACNVAQQRRDPHSALAFWRAMLQLRKAHAATCVFGDFTPIDAGDGPVFAYRKTAVLHADGEHAVGAPSSRRGSGCSETSSLADDDEERASDTSARNLLVLLNLSNQDGVEFFIPKEVFSASDETCLALLASTHSVAASDLPSSVWSEGRIVMQAYEGFIFAY